MKNQRLYLFLFFLTLISKTFSQGYLLTPPVLEFDGTQLSILYDVVASGLNDEFYVWVEISKASGELINTKALSGDVGANVRSGTNKKITWMLNQDNVFLDETISVEVKAEKYEKSFKKGSAMLMSTALPGLGQTKISKGKPWWITGIVAYGALAGGLVTHSGFIKTYDEYRVETNPAKRSDLLSRSENQMNLSNALIVTGAVLWVANIVWVAVTPNRYQPLKYVKISVVQPSGPLSGTTMLTMRLNF
jgi:hypothetical protein